MPPELRMRTAIINTTRHWPNGTVPIVIDRVFSEYCTTRLKRGLRLSQHGRQMEASYATELLGVGQDKRDTSM